MITVYKELEVKNIDSEQCLDYKGDTEVYKRAIFFDLEHYVFKKPICLGVFGAAHYDEKKNKLILTQYMIENSKDAIEILKISEKYFRELKEKENKKYLVTFSGNNDYLVINHLFNKNKINFDLREKFDEVDLQKEFYTLTGKGIGLKNLEKIFDIERYGDLISGSNLAKIFAKINKDYDYINRMPKKKRENILIYNEEDVVNLFNIYIDWNKYITGELIEETKKEVVRDKALREEKRKEMLLQRQQELENNKN